MSDASALEGPSGVGYVLGVVFMIITVVLPIAYGAQKGAFLRNLSSK